MLTYNKLITKKATCLLHVSNMWNIGTLCVNIFWCQILADSCQYISRKQKELGDFREDFRQKEKRLDLYCKRNFVQFCKNIKLNFAKLCIFAEAGKVILGFNPTFRSSSFRQRKNRLCGRNFEDVFLKFACHFAVILNYHIQFC